MLPSASLFITRPSWTGNSASCLCSVRGWVGFWPFSLPLCFSSSWTTVRHWPLCMWLFPPFAIVLLRYMAPRSNRFLLCFGYLAVHLGPSDFILCVHYQDYFENPICQSEKKGFLHLFLSHDCHFHLLWELHIHVCQPFSKRKGVLDQRSSYSEHFCCSHDESIYIYPEEPASEASL